MEYAVFRLAMRSLVFLVAFALCVSHLVRKRDFIDAVFRSPDEVRKSFSGRNDVLFLRVLNIVPMVVAVATAGFLVAALLDVPGLSTGITSGSRASRSVARTAGRTFRASAAAFRYVTTRPVRLSTSRCSPAMSTRVRGSRWSTCRTRATARSSSGADGYLICSLTASKEMLAEEAGGFPLASCPNARRPHVGRGSQSGLRCLDHIVHLIKKRR